MNRTLKELRVELVPCDDKVIRGFVNKEELRQAAIEKCRELQREAEFHECKIPTCESCKQPRWNTYTVAVSNHLHDQILYAKRELMTFLNLTEEDLK